MKKQRPRKQSRTSDAEAKAHKGMLAWEKLLKRKDEKRNLMALIYLVDLRNGKVPRRVEIEIRGEVQKTPSKKLILKLYRKALKGDAAAMREILNGLFGEPPPVYYLEGS